MVHNKLQLFASFGRTLLLAGSLFAGIALGGVPCATAEEAKLQVSFDARTLFPDADGKAQIGEVKGTPPIAEVVLDGRPIGYAFSTWDITESVGYSGQPIDVHVGLSKQGEITGAQLISHQEPILVIGVKTKDLEELVGGLAGIDVRAGANTRRAGSSAPAPDHITGATISSAVIKDAVLRAARRVARRTGIIASAAAGRPTVNREEFEKQSWNELVENRAITRLRLSRGQVAEALAIPPEEPEKLFLDIHVALLTPPTIGRNLLGRQDFQTTMAALAANEHAILIAANGLYSFKGTSYRRKGVFDRFQLVQGSKTIRLHKDDYSYIEKLALPDAPHFREIGIFRIRGDAGLQGALPWRLQLLVKRTDPEGRTRTAQFDLDYVLPSALTVEPAASAGLAAEADTMPDLATTMWLEQQPQIVIVTTMILVLIVVLLFHDVISRHTRAFRYFRIGFLICTFLIIGLYAGAQISIVNVIAFLKALLGEFKWENFLLSPLSFIIWSFVALALLFWGRGVFCGWLCPFGALQELTNELAKKFGVRQIQIPWPIHERLWPIKYVAFLLIIGLALRSTVDAYQLAEIEPFKTAIAMRFMREWPYVLYVLVLLGVGLFVERFYCRYLCPLGAGLAIPAKLRLFEWLKRRPQCGRECHICEVRCTVQAINPLGQLNPNECIYCLKCQANFHDAETCLALKRRAFRRAGSASAPAFPAGPAEG